MYASSEVKNAKTSMQSVWLSLFVCCLISIITIYPMVGGVACDKLKGLLNLLERSVDEQLFRAVLDNDVAKVQEALENGADLNVNLPGVEQTPIILASVRGYGEITKFLLDYGACPNAQNAGQPDPLSKAKSFACIDHLLVYGACPDFESDTLSLGRLFTVQLPF